MKKYFAVFLFSFFGVITKVQADPHTEQQAVTKAQIIRKFPGIKRQLTPKYFDVIYPLFAYIPANEKGKANSLIAELKMIPVQSLERIVESVRFFATKKGKIPKIVEIIKELREIPEDQRKEIAEKAANFIAKKKKRDKKYIIGTIRIVRVMKEVPEVSADRQEEIFENVVQFIRPEDYSNRFVKGEEKHKEVKNALYVT